jgi:hypothetical protein
MEKHKNEFIKRTKRRDNFVVIGNEVIQDNRMTIEARGVLVFLLSLPQDWVVRKNDLQKRLAVSRRTIDRCFDEMKQCGYLCETDFVKKDGKFDGKGYLIYDYSIYKNAPEMYSTDAQGEQRNDFTDAHGEHWTDAHGEQLLKKEDIQQRTNNTGGALNSSSPINPVKDTLEHRLDGGRAAAARFVKPSIEEVQAYAKTKHVMSDMAAKQFAEEFWNFYESNGWLVGKAKMKSWTSAVAGTWKKTANKLNESSGVANTSTGNVKFNIQ